MRYDESEHERAVRLRNLNTPIGGLFAVQHPAPSVPSPASESAADALTHTRKGKDRRATQLHRVLSLIASRESGYTIDEIDAETNLGTGALCARVDDLRTMGWIDTSATIMRKTRRGRSAAVHFATPSGRAKLLVAA